jgi:hypothetical protein
MAGAHEYGELEAKLPGMSDSDIVSALERPDDYEPWALELFRAELGRRNIPAPVHEELRKESAVQAASEERMRANANTRIFSNLIAVTLFFLVIVWRVCAHGR